MFFTPSPVGMLRGVSAWSRPSPSGDSQRRPPPPRATGARRRQQAQVTRQTSSLAASRVCLSRTTAARPRPRPTTEMARAGSGNASFASTLPAPPLWFGHFLYLSCRFCSTTLSFSLMSVPFSVTVTVIVE